eukprot:jgi/Phyca11/568174/estExt2_Genewise1.C_PHYCAscaffold_270447
MHLAGGYDAICVVVIHERSLQEVEDLWVHWPTTHPDSMYVSTQSSCHFILLMTILFLHSSICPLLCDIDRDLTGVSSVKAGLQFHSAE